MGQEADLSATVLLHPDFYSIDYSTFLNSFTRTLGGKFAHVKCFAALPRETLYDFTDFVYLMNVEMGQADADWL